MAQTDQFAGARQAARHPARVREAGFVRPGFAALIFTAAIVGILIVAPERFLSGPSAPQMAFDAPEGSPEPPEARAGRTQNRQELARQSEPLAPEDTPPPSTHAPPSEETEAPNVFSTLWRQVKDQAAKARHLPLPTDLMRAGNEAGLAASPFDGPDRSVPAIDLGLVLRNADGVARWQRLTGRFPDLQGLDPVLVQTRLFKVMPVRRLAALGAPEKVLREVCAELTAFGTPCKAATIRTGTVSHAILTGTEERPEGDPALPGFETGFQTPSTEATRQASTMDAGQGAFQRHASTGAPHFTLRSQASQDARVRIIAVGDVMMGSDYPSRAGLNPELVPGAALGDILEDGLVRLLKSGDLTFANLEGVLLAGGEPTKDCVRCFAFRSPPHYADFLRQAGVDVVSLANNHAGDFGDAGRAATIAALRRAGIAPTGLETMPEARTASLTTEAGIRVAFASFAPHGISLDPRDLGGARRIVATLSEDHDVVVISVHAGAEGVGASRVPRHTERYLGEDRGDVHAFARAVIDAGADLVVGHGPHVPRALEIIDDRLVAYSLGNFWTSAGFLTWGLLGLGPVLDVTLDGQGRLVEVTLHSTRQAGEGVPRLDRRHEAARFVLDRTARDFPATLARLRQMRLAQAL